MRLGLDSFRAIKPVGCIDDYMAGDVIGCTRAEEGEIFLKSIMVLIKKKAMSVPQISKITGRSRAAIARRLNTQKNKGSVTCVNRGVPGVKPTGFWTTVEVA